VDLDEADSMLHGQERLRHMIRDFAVKFLFDSKHQLDCVQAIDPEIVHEAGVVLTMMALTRAATSLIAGAAASLPNSFCRSRCRRQIALQRGFGARQSMPLHRQRFPKGPTLVG
jgi:hypothetical protein